MITHLSKIASFLILLLFSISVFAQPSVEAGKTTFKNNCASCHSKDMKTMSTGPALSGVEERWADYPIEDLYNWVRNSQKMITSDKHPRAVELWNEYKPSIMTALPDLTDDDIASIMLYIDDVVNNVPTPIDAVGGAVAEDAGNNYKWLYWILLITLGALSIVLAKITGSLDKMVAINEGNPYDDRPLLKRILSKRNISFLIFGLVVIGGYCTVTNAVNLGRQQNYAPEQPIQFSHETHAGVNQIDCQYCHDGARRSKHSVIPGANTCMNCHSAIQTGSKYGTAELTKIYASIGYNPNKGTYIENYDALEEPEIEEIYKEWITDNYLDTKDILTLDSKGIKEVNKQWKGIKESLTNEQKTKIQGPIEWIRVHNLPDHVYFSHEQHVTVGEVECQSCHGKVEDMTVLKQHAPLSMGWCVNCHRQTEVKFEDNPYYASYENYHKQLADGDKEKVTVEDIGGLECQKCHY